jgi:hypothetical protein
MPPYTSLPNGDTVGVVEKKLYQFCWIGFWLQSTSEFWPERSPRFGKRRHHISGFASCHHSVHSALSVVEKITLFGSIRREISANLDETLQISCHKESIEVKTIL